MPVTWAVEPADPGDGHAVAGRVEDDRGRTYMVMDFEKGRPLSDDRGRLWYPGPADEGPVRDASGVARRAPATGPGVPEEARDRIFEPLFTYGKREGAGLGLSIVKDIAEANGGRVFVTDRPGGGAVFGIRFDQERPPVG